MTGITRYIEKKLSGINIEIRKGVDENGTIDEAHAYVDGEIAKLYDAIGAQEAKDNSFNDIENLEGQDIATHQSGYEKN